MAVVGRKTKFTPERVKRIMELLREGKWTECAIAKKVGIDRSLLKKWKAEKKDFLAEFIEAQNDGLENVLDVVENTLYKKAKGYSVEEKSETYVRGVLRESKTTKKHVQPCYNSIQYILSNRRSDKWKNKLEQDIKVPTDIQIVFMPASAPRAETKPEKNARKTKS